MSLLTSFIPSRSRSDRSQEPIATRKPAYEVRETADAYGLTVFLPGVSKDGLEITAEGNELRIIGRTGWKQPADWTPLYREAPQAAFELALAHDNAVDIDKIHAELKDGTLRMSLPKAESLKPRKITVA
jgi:HSP20 family molecular chaperone IbpA